MIFLPVYARQPVRAAWSHERLVREWSLALGMFINNSTYLSYCSALNSYLNFVNLHNFNIKSTPDTLFFYIVYMCNHIKFRSVQTYLSDIYNQLEVYYLQI